MEVTLKPDNRKATIIGGISDDLVKVRLEDGREFPWPISKINMPAKEGEEALKMVVVPAIDRLAELESDRKKLGFGLDGQTDKKYKELLHELRRQAAKEFIHKWGLYDTEERGHSTNEGVKYTLP